MFERLKTLFVAVAGIIALAPAASLATSMVDMPPSFDGFLTFVASATGPIVFFLVYLARKSLLRIGTQRLLVAIAVTSIAGLVLAYVTFEVTDQHIRTYRYIDPAEGEGVQEEKYILPDHYSEELSNIVNGQFRGRLDNAIKNHPAYVLELLSRDSRSVQRKIIIYFVLAHVLLIFGFLLGGWACLSVAEDEERKRNQNGPPAE